MTQQIYSSPKAFPAGHIGNMSKGKDAGIGEICSSKPTWFGSRSAKLSDPPGRGAHPGLFTALLSLMRIRVSRDTLIPQRRLQTILSLTSLLKTGCLSLISALPQSLFSMTQPQELSPLAVLSRSQNTAPSTKRSFILPLQSTLLRQWTQASVIGATIAIRSL